MFNLLPENLRKSIIAEYRLRFTVVVIIFLIVIQVSFLFFLFPTWLSSFYREKDFSLQNDEANKSLSTLDIGSTTSFIKTFNSKLNIIDESLEYPKFSPIIDEVLSKKISAIRIYGIYYTVSSANTGTLTISGIGDNRESLVTYTEKLREISYLKKVDLPISNLAKERNIEFTININIEK